MSQPLSQSIRWAILVTALIDLVLGVLFLFAPEIGVSLWPTPVGAVLSRFIGSIVLANGVGALMLSRPRTTWAEARVLITVAVVYGIIVLVALLYHVVVLGSREPFFIIYAIVDAVFLIPIAIIYWQHERRG